jgi:putative alpha-1,2-mannosidase
LFAAAGRPDLTQYWVRRVMNELYNPDHFAGDEDTGSMSAWFILSALGFYALCPGKPSYILGSPLFDYVTLDVENGRKTTIEALNNGAKNYFVKNLRVNGALHQDNSISHELITRGSSLRFEMTEEREAAR